MSQSKRPSRLGLLLPIGLFAALFGIYSVYWLFVAQQIRVGTETWISDQRARGVEVNYTDWRVDGFPYRFALTATDPVLADPALGWGWRGETLQMVAMPWDLNTVLARIPGENRLLGPMGETLNTTFDDKAVARMTFQGGYLMEFGLSFDSARVEGPDAQTLSIGATNLHLRPMPERERNLQLAFQMTGLELPQALPDAPWLGPSVDNMIVLAEVTEAYSAYTQSSAPFLSAWRHLSGKLDLRRAELAWGPLHLGAKGEIGLDSAARPDGLLQVRIDRADELRASLVAANAMTNELQAGIGMLELLSQNDNFAPIQLKDGGAYVAGQRLADLPL